MMDRGSGGSMCIVSFSRPDECPTENRGDVRGARILCATDDRSKPVEGMVG